MTKLVWISIGVLAVSLGAQTPTAPPQPTTGPGGSTLLFTKGVEYGPFYSLPNNTQAYNSYYIYQPTTPAASSLPVVFFLHGELLKAEGPTQGDSPSNYIFWFKQMVLMGYTVVYPVWDGTAPQNQYFQNVMNAYSASLALLQSRTVPGLIPPATDALGLQVACAGHSFGAYLCFDLTQTLTVKPVQGVAPPRAIASFEIGTGGGQYNFNFSQISSNTYVVMVKGDEDDGVNNDDGISDQVWDSLVNNIPAAQKDYLEVVSDSHGTPAQLGNHWYPLTDGFQDTAGVDDRDYNVTWKLSIGLFNCAFQNTNCDYGLGHGSFNQVNMGTWSDGVPVAQLEVEDN